MKGSIKLISSDCRMGYCTACNKFAFISTVDAEVTEPDGEMEYFHKDQCSECLSNFIMSVRKEWPDCLITYEGRSLEQIQEGVKVLGMEGLAKKMADELETIRWHNNRTP